jgi:DNA-binding response OmpR family regulator
VNTKRNNHIILVADDDEEFRLLVRSTLEPSNYAVVEAESGDVAIKKFRTLQPSLVMLDVMMPELNGFDVCKEIRQSPNGLNTPIVMVTSLDDVESIRKAFAMGATDFITKPVDWQMLAMRVDFLLRANQRIMHSIQMAIDASSNPAIGIQSNRPPELDYLESQLGSQLLREFLGVIDESLKELNYSGDDEQSFLSKPKSKPVKSEGLEESNLLHIRLQEMKTGTEFINPYIVIVQREIQGILTKLEEAVSSKHVLDWIQLLLRIKPHSDYLGCISLSDCIEDLLFTQTENLTEVMESNRERLVNELNKLQQYLAQELSDDLSVE